MIQGGRFDIEGAWVMEEKRTGVRRQRRQVGGRREMEKMSVWSRGGGEKKINLRRHIREE